MYLSEVFHYNVIIQRRGVVPSEAMVFQTTVKGGSFVNVVYHVLLVLQKKVKIGGVLSLLNFYKSLADNREAPPQVYADSGGERVLFFFRHVFRASNFIFLFHGIPF